MAFVEKKDSADRMFPLIEKTKTRQRKKKKDSFPLLNHRLTKCFYSNKRLSFLSVFVFIPLCWHLAVTFDIICQCSCLSFILLMVFCMIIDLAVEYRLLYLCISWAIPFPFPASLLVRPIIWFLAFRVVFIEPCQLLIHSLLCRD